jgi:hypothetical protein
MAGCLFAMMVSTELRNKKEDGRAYGNRGKRLGRADLIARAIGRKDLQKSELYPKIKAAVEASSLFA